jgi:hypothetical protein
MAKKPPAVPAPEGAATGKDVSKMITAVALDRILKLDKRTKGQQAELAGELGSEIAKAVERFGTNRKALGIIRTLNRMEPEKLADFLDHFDYMLDVSGLEKRAEQVQRLPMDGAKAPKDGADDEAEEGSVPAADEGKVTRPRFGTHGGGGPRVN